ncbi:MAG TPA: hypothetical protein VGP72_24110 [Planctomycetota bacterium]|jgi:hypothetical protein
MKTIRVRVLLLARVLVLLAWSLNAADSQPAITSSLTASGAASAAFSYTITESGTGPIMFSAAPLPDGITLSGCTLSGTPTDAGTTDVTLTAASAAGSDSQTLIITINPAGAPTITSAGNLSGNVGTALSYQIAATGNDTISYNATNLPAGLGFAGNTISGTPTTTSRSNVTLSATNALGSDTKFLQLTINAAGAPTITSALSASAQVKQAFSYTITAKPAGSITFAATGLPSWLALSGAVLSGTPDSPGNYAVQLAATNTSGSDTQTLQIVVAPENSQPPVVTAITISRNPVRTNTDVTFAVQATSLSGLPLYYSWYFFLNHVRDGAPVSGSTVTRQFGTEGEYDVVAVASDGYATSLKYSTVTITLAPNSGGDGQNITDGATPLYNPDSGLGIKVSGSLGGVLNVDIDPGLPRASETFQTDFLNGRAAVSGVAIAGKFQHSKIFVATTTASENGQVTRKMRRMIPVSTRETGEGLNATAAPGNSGIQEMKLKGHCSFGGKDLIGLSGTVELPAGMKLGESMDVPVGIGNLVDIVRLTGKGKYVSNQQGLVVKMQVSFPRLKKGVTATTAGMKARLALTLSGTLLHDKGLDTEGITSSRTLTQKTKYLRRIQTAIVLGGVSYETIAPVDYMYSDQSGGTFVGRRAQ